MTLSFELQSTNKTSLSREGSARISEKGGKVISSDWYIGESRWILRFLIYVKLEFKY